jgi:hypothetical protein
MRKRKRLSVSTPVELAEFFGDLSPEFGLEDDEAFLSEDQTFPNYFWRIH